ncbi:hypothetical protein MTO98_08625 [Mucilaginibacter sp. SMC90]|uniref:hypothetical protein n=1 Tax=Mucilaginibacter sp. SMC90 TaxID=2929803 RepID=UPI001FB45326|nr:hypothetical protein [Mucilaginibacter sp. SMC90]UOE51138.1 hypothetical protein MTO98_08625 [Mucilaginibacter sp. SMC90]
MKTISNSIVPPIAPISLGKNMLLGWGIGLILISVFLFQVNEPNPAWGKLWMIRPLIITPLAGAAGGGIYYFMDQLRRMRSWNKVLFQLLSLILFIIALWLGIVLGLDGTLWN